MGSTSTTASSSVCRDRRSTRTGITACPAPPATAASSRAPATTASWTTTWLTSAVRDRRSKRCISAGIAPDLGSLQRDVVADEAAVDGDLVVERAGHGVALVGQPVEAAAALAPRPVGHRGDQRPPGALAPRRLVGEEVLQVAYDRPRGAGVDEEMRDAHQLLLPRKGGGGLRSGGGALRPQPRPQRMQPVPGHERRPRAVVH